jgi:tetratricopeptide (TPR) repeat protein
MRTGRYEAAVRANQAAIEADRRYLAQLDAQGAYRVGYVAHNHHFLWAAAAMDGRGDLALTAARDAWPAACGPANRDLGSAILQHYYVLPLFALVRFGRWDAILTDTLPADAAEPYPLAIWHYARGTAWTRKGRVEEARREFAALEKVARDPALGRARIKNINSTDALLRIAMLTLRADIASAEGDPAEAARLLAKATHIEDALAYDEPHLWLAPTRHALGAALLAANRPDAAERVYREDLRHYPDNPWSLAGLSESLQRQRKETAAADAKRRLAVASARADVKISASRL